MNPLGEREPAQDHAQPPLHEHEHVVVTRDADADYTSIIAVHSTARGPAIGGTRLLVYASEEDALAEALRLSRAMTYKTALAGLRAGGGKAVILAPVHLRSREALFRAHGRAVEALGGRYVTAMDVGMTLSDLAAIARETTFVALHGARGGADGSDTARGVVRAMLAAVRFTAGVDSMRGVRVAIQGCGNVGAVLARLLAGEGATLVVADVDASRAERVRAATGAVVVAVDRILSADVDIVAPCALGSGIDAHVVETMRAAMIVGGANNQLSAPQLAIALRDRGITYVPDFVANAGGVIGGAGEREGWSATEIATRIDSIYDTTLRVLRTARTTQTTPLHEAEVLAQRALVVCPSPGGRR